MTYRKLDIKVGDIITTGSNKANGLIISIATLSRYTHISIAASEKSVYEYTRDNGISESNVADCFKDTHTITIYRRRKPLNKKEMINLHNAYQEIKNHTNESKYSIAKALHAGLVPIAYNLSLFLLLVCTMLDYILDDINLNMSTVLLAASLIIIHMAKNISMMLSGLYKSKLTQRLSGDFCSNFAVMLDAISGGKLYSGIYRNHDPRPKDVVSACKEFDYIEIHSDNFLKSITDNFET
jgi:hypothetical protein